MNLAPDISFFIQLGLFFTVYLLLNFLLIQPALRVLDKRKTVTQGVKEAVEGLRHKTDKLIADYEGKLYQAKLRGAALKEKIKKEGEAEGERILSKAREAADSHLTEMQARLAKEQDAAELQLKKMSEELAKKMAEKVLERSLS